ncbi:MAG: hypothetical protein ACO32Z_01830 [Gemmatimonadaceae bacterium]|jgi:hypothetical protein
MRSFRRATIVAALFAVSALGACTEELRTTAACPGLCPGQQVPILDTVIDPAVVLDTTLQPFPVLGGEPALFLAARGDTLDVRAVVRFDTLPRQYSPVGDTLTAISVVDSATLAVQLKRTGAPLPATIFLDAYDVTDTVAADSAPLTLLPYFTPARRLGSVQIDSAAFRDSIAVTIPIDTAMLRSIVTDTLRLLRIGLQLRALGSAEVTVTGSTGGSAAPTLRYRASADTAVKALTARPFSTTPVTPIGLAGEFQDYLIVVRAPDPMVAGRFVVGGIPGHRSYLRFDLPSWLTDSVAVLTAKLELTQEPIRGLDPTRSFVVRAHVGLGAWELADLNRAARLLAPVGTFITDSLVLAPGDSGITRLEMNGVIRQWRTNNGRRAVPSVLILRPEIEGATGLAARFYGTGAAPALRPRLRISYVPAIRYGQP